MFSRKPLANLTALLAVPFTLALGVGKFVALRFTLAGKSIYFVVIDRFARSGEQAVNTTPCDLPADWVNNTGGGFCGGTINGITKQLDYIQAGGMQSSCAGCSSLCGCC